MSGAVMPSPSPAPARSGLITAPHLCLVVSTTFLAATRALASHSPTITSMAAHSGPLAATVTTTGPSRWSARVIKSPFRTTSSSTQQAVAQPSQPPPSSTPSTTSGATSTATPSKATPPARVFLKEMSSRTSSKSSSPTSRANLTVALITPLLALLSSTSVAFARVISSFRLVLSTGRILAFCRSLRDCLLRGLRRLLLRGARFLEMLDSERSRNVALRGLL
ncbi:hypothetical protein FOXG_02513 [Fusarium oxysporum f. sp. lycopersici 4287]|uniref:Uncharacterized protein n=1 Tax=Fusarium oxysporum f. sp. lycopersici (strain 4287 / CBS 123668 / FGSC 9935 / NRRL 34936) TaxID=426428 RepID=A0A0J9UIU1_FUSO4|nr:hypothetical protein FOXG_02513 [Fusarium oxysporum f. sp. lycopersici 4287]KNA98070.1 hypothetical protein FOXG_02513 [Fusarium oxysporum f. sp. lycopersici 4287]